MSKAYSLVTDVNPDEPFQNFWTSKSVGRRIIRSLGTTCEGTRLVEGLVGLDANIGGNATDAPGRQELIAS